MRASCELRVASCEGGGSHEVPEVLITQALAAASSLLIPVAPAFAQVRPAGDNRQVVRLGERWAAEYLPAALHLPGPFDVLWWQWIALIVMLPLAALAGSLASRLTRTVLARLASRTRASWDDAVIVRLSGPLTLALTFVFVAVLLQYLSLSQPAGEFMYRLVRAGLYVTVFWAMLRLVDVAVHQMAESPWSVASPSSRALLPLARRVAKIIVLAIAVIAVLSLLGYPVASLLAGLGLGGLALALAAQKTVENLFGTFSIGVDQPLREGDFVRVEDFVGTVEGIGLRSTRFRTLDRTLITIPNGRLADMRIESFAARDRLRLAMVVGLVYETTADQLREVVSGFERVLREHPLIWPERVVVLFHQFGASSLDIEVMAWFQTADWAQFQSIRHETLIKFMEVVQAAGTSFAFPTRTVHLVRDPQDGNSDGTAPDVSARSAESRPQSVD